MTIERLNEILEDEKTFGKGISSDKVFEGLEILRKYNPYVIQGADHDEIYSLDVTDSFLQQITEEDAIRLSELGWFIDFDSDCLAHFV
jgi:hypothetical protein